MTVTIGISPYAEVNVFFRAMRRMGGWRPVAWLFARALPPADRLVWRVTGRTTTLAGRLTGLPVLLLTTTGAKTGVQRTTPLLFLRDGDDFVVTAANWGQGRNPSWYYNLRAHPQAQVTVAGSTHDVLAREAAGPQRELYWQQGCRMYPAWNAYKHRAPDREIPVIVLSRAPRPEVHE